MNYKPKKNSLWQSKGNFVYLYKKVRYVSNDGIHYTAYKKSDHALYYSAICQKDKWLESQRPL